MFCIADDFCKEFDKEAAKTGLESSKEARRRHRSWRMSRSEIMTILICFHFGSFRNFKHYYLFYVKEHLAGLLPGQLSYTRFVELESRLSVEMMLLLQVCCFGRCTGISFVDGTCIPVCHNKRIRRNMKNRLIPLYDKLLQRKRSVMETINDELKNVAQLVHSRHRSVFNFAMNALSAIAVYSFFDKKPSVNTDFCIEDKGSLLTVL
ncbi:MAG: transposase [Prevotella sp.]|nr:transposase [Prevotella sp.]